MKNITISLAILGFLLAIVRVITSYKRIRKQQKEEIELLKLIYNHRSKFQKLNRTFEQNQIIIENYGFDFDINSEEKKKELFAKYVLKLLEHQKGSKLEEVEDALFLEDHELNKNYVDKIYHKYLELG